MRGEAEEMGAVTDDRFDYLPGIKYLFTTRNGPALGGPLDFDHRKGDDRLVTRSYETAAAYFGVPTSSIFVMRQEHGDAIAAFRSLPKPESMRAAIEVDGVVAGYPGLVLVVLTADCLPILLADTRRGVVAAVHAGWKGTVLGIAGKAARTMEVLFGSDPADIHAALGPAIGRCCYEVGPEVVAAARDAFPFAEEYLDLKGDGKAMLDLVGINRRLLSVSGVDRDRISSIDLCTKCRDDLFYSYRREGEKTGRMLSGIMLKG
jgi:YfiH family protein